MSPTKPDRRDGACVGLHENKAGHEVRLPAERPGHAQGGREKEKEDRSKISSLNSFYPE